MEELLTKLLQELERIGELHSEIYDSHVREHLSAVIHNGFVNQSYGYIDQGSFGMFSEEGDRLVKQALESYVSAAKQKAAELGMICSHDRLEAFQNDNAVTPNGSYYDDFFGWTSPEQFNTGELDFQDP